MSLKVLVIEGNRYLINEESKVSDKQCNIIIDSYPPETVYEFEKPKLSDLL